LEGSPPSTRATLQPLASTADGLSLTVVLEPAVVHQGDVVTITATLRNGGNRPATYGSTGCGAATGWASVPVPSEPTGRGWDGVEGRFKHYALTEGLGPGVVSALESMRVELRDACAGEGGDRALDPGASVTNTLTWRAELLRGVPALPGTVPLTISASYDPQGAPPSYPPGYDGPMGSWMRLYKQLEVEASVEVVGEAPSAIAPGPALDAILADRTFSEWLRARPAKTWGAVNLFLTGPGDEGLLGKIPPSWDIELFRENGVPRNWAIGFVDAVTGEVVSVAYCDVPCDR
jgi:hypothetical protein